MWLSGTSVGSRTRRPRTRSVTPPQRSVTSPSRRMTVTPEGKSPPLQGTVTRILTCLWTVGGHAISTQTRPDWRAEFQLRSRAPASGPSSKTKRSRRDLPPPRSQEPSLVLGLLSRLSLR
ncbi:hypothetical protein GN956_G24719 [Arapaima gigas]